MNLPRHDGRGMTADRKIAIIADHCPWPGIGQVATAADGFRFYPTPFTMQL